MRNATSRAVTAGLGMLPYLLGFMLAANVIVAESSHLRDDACPSVQLKLLAATWNTAGESTNALPVQLLAAVPWTSITQVPQFSARGSFSSTNKSLSAGCSK